MIITHITKPNYEFQYWIFASGVKDFLDQLLAIDHATVNYSLSVSKKNCRQYYLQKIKINEPEDGNAYIVYILLISSI